MCYLRELSPIEIAIAQDSLSGSLVVRLIVTFRLSALERALPRASPLIFNNEEGSQFTSEAFTDRLEASDIAISWNARGSYFDNIFIERLWRSVKYEEVYLNDYDSMHIAHGRLRDYFNFYSRERFHQPFDYRTPASERIASDQLSEQRRR